MKGTKTATILIMVGTGSKYETRENNGISHFLEHMFFKGTKKRLDSLTITSELDSLGSEYNAFTGKEYTGYYIKVDAAKIEKAMEVIADMFLGSVYDSSEIEREKGVVIEEINMFQDNPIMYIEDVFEQCLYGDTPSGWDIPGNKENVLSFDRNTFVDYVTAQYGPHNTAICVSGDINPAKIKSAILKHFPAKKLDARGQAFHDKGVVSVEQGQKVKLYFKETDQAHLCLGVPALPYGHKDEVILKLLSVILGGSMSSRMFINLREKNGLCYYVSTSNEVYTDNGYVSTRAGLKMDSIEKAIELILAEYRRIAEELVPVKELKRNKDLIAGRLALQLEASDDIANWYAKQAIMIGTVEREGVKDKDRRFAMKTPEHLIKAVNAVTAADIRRVARSIFHPENLYLAIIGPFKDETRFKKLLKF